MDTNQTQTWLCKLWQVLGKDYHVLWKRNIRGILGFTQAWGREICDEKSEKWYLRWELENKWNEVGYEKEVGSRQKEEHRQHKARRQDWALGGVKGSNHLGARGREGRWRDQVRSQGTLVISVYHLACLGLRDTLHMKFSALKLGQYWANQNEKAFPRDHVRCLIPSLISERLFSWLALSHWQTTVMSTSCPNGKGHKTEVMLTCSWVTWLVR